MPPWSTLRLVSAPVPIPVECGGCALESILGISNNFQHILRIGGMWISQDMNCAGDDCGLDDTISATMVSFHDAGKLLAALSAGTAVLASCETQQVPGYFLAIDGWVPLMSFRQIVFCDHHSFLSHHTSVPDLPGQAPDNGWVGKFDMRTTSRRVPRAAPDFDVLLACRGNA